LMLLVQLRIAQRGLTAAISGRNDTALVPLLSFLSK